ncbi:endonuclease/exonuclease/phosphatase family protein [Cognataquiflexum rubidum]|uniref:endonuclease/exonuclease/phosphatase family protein n=1 Tax=Cognataquiflexum rubidum TaxID=2922273 RepID=UPI001F12C648|nr:endonuclease/exonuclease/phosphatase family protein [Cognataquiflexum rubidum]MCH6233262.1 endonuclease/exonuclease/phosphatase family protein [Cognataquiflexum rubidum]
MKKFYLFLLFAMISDFAVFAQSGIVKKEITLMTYNIYHGEDPYNPGTGNIREIADLINNIKPDLVALQEVDSMTNRTKNFNREGKMDVVHELGKLTGMTPFFAKAIDFSEGGYGEGILSRLPVTFHAYSLPIPNGGEERSLAVASVDLGNGKTITFAATHLCHEFAENRTAQVVAIKNILSEFKGAKVLTGDFNFTSEETGYSILSEDFLDVALKHGNPQNTYSSKDPKIRIDYFWLEKETDWEIVSVEVLDVEYSDHKPVLIKVRLLN